MNRDSLLARIPIVLLTLSLVANVWQYGAAKEQQQSFREGAADPPHAKNNPPGMNAPIPTKTVGKSKPEPHGIPDPPVDPAKKPAPLADMPQDKSQPPPPPPRDPFDVFPPLSQERVKLADLQAMYSQETPAGSIIEVEVDMKEQGATDSITIPATVRLGERSTVQKFQEFPYPTRFDPPLIDPASKFLRPSSPDRFLLKNTGWKVDFTISARGRFLFLEGTLTLVQFTGFEASAGLPFLPVEDENGKLLTDNRHHLPRFTTQEIPFFDAVQSGETLRMPISSPKGDVTLEMSVRRSSSE